MEPVDLRAVLAAELACLNWRAKIHAEYPCLQLPGLVPDVTCLEVAKIFDFEKRRSQLLWRPCRQRDGTNLLELDSPLRVSELRLAGRLYHVFSYSWYCLVHFQPFSGKREEEEEEENG